ncbi:MAG: DNA recombination protein RmuC [Patescibacteria group bacterium]|nr:DNA recombination protein RmuC [Patescibacteria group bacterium]
MTEALIIVSFVASAAIGAVVWLLLRSQNSPKMSEESGKINKVLDLLLKDTRDLRVDQKVTKETSQKLQSEMRSLGDFLNDFRSRQDERNQKEDEYNFLIRDSIKNIEHLFKGSKSKGMAGENILREIFKIFPPELIVFDYRVEGRPVEFGLKLPDGRIVPMDSKVIAVEEMSQLTSEVDDATRQRLIKKVENEVQKKIKEVSSYVHPPITWDKALMLVPDSVYAILKESFMKAYSQSVILIPYNMAIPYILTFLDLHSKTLATLDEQQVKSFLEDLDRTLLEMEIVLENQVARGNTMVSNAYNDYKRMFGKIRGRMTYLEEAEKASLAAPKKKVAVK